VSAATAQLIAQARERARRPADGRFVAGTPWDGAEYVAFPKDGLSALAAALEAAEARTLPDSEDEYFAALDAARKRAEAAEAQRDTLAAALEEIESFPMSRYHAWAAQRIARAALAAVKPPEEQP
jgi:hypothetical protein